MDAYDVACAMHVSLLPLAKHCRMNSQRFPAVALLAGALFAVSAPLSTDGPSFAPTEGSDVSRTFSTELDLQLDSFSLQANGEDMTGVLGEFEFNLRTELEISISDTYAGLNDERPTKLERTFDSLEGSTIVSTTTMMGSEDQDFSASSELEGKTVLFNWDEDDESYTVTWDDGEEDEEMLGGLTEDMDLRALLPEDEVSKGDSWTIELSELAPLATPGGNLRLVPDELEGAGDMDMGFFDEMREEFSEQVAELFEGECVCTFKEIREEDGAKLAEISIELEIASAANVADMLMDFISTMGEQFGETPEVDIESADINLDFEGEGTLFWDLEAGRAASFEISGEAILGLDLAVAIEVPDGSQTIEASIEMSGSYEQKVEMSD